jgi:hypothetical protein
VTDKHNASDSALGYLFQLRYALLCGILEGKTNISHAISIEQFDDIALDNAGSPIALVQTKHSVSPGDLSDQSVSLWKTIGIWIERVRGNPLAASDQRFLLITTSTAAEDSAASKLRPNRSEDDIDVAIALLLAAANTSKNKITDGARRAFEDLDVELRKLLIKNVWVFDNGPTINDARDEIEKELIFAAPQDQLSNFTDYLEGWWFQRAIDAMTGVQEKSIPLFAIRGKIDELRENFQIGRLPLDVSIENMPPIQTLPDDSRMIVQQMRVVGVSNQAAHSAVHDFYRAYEQRSKWARQSLLLDGEAERYDRQLKDAWQRKMEEKSADISEKSSEEKAKIGREVFFWSRSFERPLRNRIELWISAGSFQILADTAQICWHPEYKMSISTGQKP